VALTRRMSGTEWQIVARKGSRPPGTPEGAQWASFPSYALGDHGTVAFLGRLLKPKAGTPNPANVTGANDVGLWFALPGEEPRLLLREGDALGEGSDAKRVRNFIALTAVSGSPAQRRAFSADGDHLVIKLFATDGTQHLLLITLPAPQRPREQ
jgi:hypothetical protein